jgi:hypothetical protein
MPEGKHEWTLWVVAVSCALHATEEYLTGWQAWARETLGIVMPTGRFLAANAVLVMAALVLAGTGWRRPSLTLLIPAMTLSNGVLFHMVPTLVQGRVSPGVYTATLLYLPFSSWALVGAARDGIARRVVVTAFCVGTLIMCGFVLAVRLLSAAPEAIG